jgi:ATP adenylyltransferase
LERLWSPWRGKYIASGVDSQADGCILCRIAANPNQDAENFVIHRGEHAFVVLNLYPYITGHLMVVPYQHTSELDSLAKEISDEMMDLAKRSQTALREVYSPSGFNMGINLGSAAGAGIADHVHIHLLPRWTGDTNFMTVVGDVRVLPEEIAQTAARLRPAFARLVGSR